MLDALKKHVAPAGPGLGFLRHAAKKNQIAASKNAKVSAVALKTAIKVATTAGKTVTAMQVHPDGSVNIALSAAELVEGKVPAANPWDELLK